MCDEVTCEGVQTYVKQYRSVLCDACSGSGFAEILKGNMIPLVKELNLDDLHC